MAYKPSTKTLKTGVDSADIINAVINDTEALSEVLPLAEKGNAASIQAIGDILHRGDIDMSNSFINALYNRIIYTIIQTMYFTNPLKRFKRGFLEAGETAEEIAFYLIRPQLYDSTSDNHYPAQMPPEAVSALHKINYQYYYKTTINRKKLLRAFVTYSGMEELVDEQISILYTSAELDEYVVMKYMLGRAALNGYIQGVSVTGTLTQAALKELSAKLRATSNNMALLKTRYNYTHVPTSSEKRKQVMIVNTDVEAYMDVEVLAEAFNMTKVEFQNNRVMIDSFGIDDVQRLNLLFGDVEGYTPFTPAELAQLNSIQAFLLDERFFMIFDVEFELTSFFNPEKLYWNKWLHTWKIVSFSTFVNAVCFSKNVAEEPTAMSLSGAATIKKGKSGFINANLTWATGEFAGNIPMITWTLTGANAANTRLSSVSETTAELFVGSGETATTLTVTASYTPASGTAVTDTFTATVKA